MIKKHKKIQIFYEKIKKLIQNHMCLKKCKLLSSKAEMILLTNSMSSATELWPSFL